MFVQVSPPQAVRPSQPFPPDLTFSPSLNNNKGIVRRGRRYQLRIRVPVILVTRLGRSEIRLSLGTTNRREALQRGLPLLERIERLFDDLRRGIVTEGTIRDICQRYYDHQMNSVPPAIPKEQLQRLMTSELFPPGIGAT